MAAICAGTGPPLSKQFRTISSTHVPGCFPLLLILDGARFLARSQDGLSNSAIFFGTCTLTKEHPALERQVSCRPKPSGIANGFYACIHLLHDRARTPNPSPSQEKQCRQIRGRTACLRGHWQLHCSVQITPRPRRRRQRCGALAVAALAPDLIVTQNQHRRCGEHK